MIENNKIDLIIIDLGGVIIDINYDATIISLEKLGISNMNKKYSQNIQEKLFDRFETGQISSFYFLNKLLDLCEKGTTPNQIVDAWNKMIGPFRPNVVNLLRQMKGYKVVLLSNTNDIHFDLVMRNWSKSYSYDFHSLFDQVFLSQKIGKRKPNKDAFEHVMEEMKVSSNNCLFIDDSIQHIKSANELGIHTHFFKSEEMLFQFFS